MLQRIHILGAAGSGTTTLGQALAEHLGCVHFDTDDYFWLPTDPPFIELRAVAERQQLLMDDLTAQQHWVLSGSLCGWGDVALPLFELVVFLWIPHDVRMARLRRREHQRYGARTMPGGDMYAAAQAFLAWAAAYDQGDLTIRSRQLHEQWLGTLRCPIVRLAGEYRLEEQLSLLMPAIS